MVRSNRKRRYTPHRGRRSGRRTLSRRVATLSRRQRATRPETKRYGVIFLNQTAAKAVGSLIPVAISELASGTSANQRIGHRVRPYRWRIRMELRMHATPTTQTARIIVVRSFSDGIITQGLDQILESPADIRSFRNVDWAGDRKVLYDKIIVLSKAATTERWSLFRSGRLNPMKEIIFDSAAGTTDRSGALGVYVITSETTNRFGWDLYARTYFTDS